ncbi:MAG: hypothetical protein HYS33_02640 [Acidobacteria bacterium]|nr:hypothetical protein [Acidobacteriota bacterium]
MASLEIPLAESRFSPERVSSDYYYQIPARPIYRSYPVYHPDREPSGYWPWLMEQEPAIAFDSTKLKTEEDWIKAGEVVFDAPIDFDPRMLVTVESVRNRRWYRALGMPVAGDGTVPFLRYVIRQKGKVELGVNSCATCHARVMPDGSVIKGAQGNMPYDRAAAFAMRLRSSEASDKQDFLNAVKRERRLALGVPWLRPDPLAYIEQMSLEDIASAHEAIPPGVTVRVNSSLRHPPQVPSLIGIKERSYLDHTGRVRHRSIGDLMRYAAHVQGALRYDRFGDFRITERLPDPSTQLRYSDEQLYALALYVYSLQPPPNPHKYDALAARGNNVFEREGCGMCHAPPLYTNNKLTPVEGFEPPAEHLKALDVFPVYVGTDPGLALRTRKGTGYYKVPSLKGVWYRGPFEHSGSVATLEDWFDPRRTREDFVPTGFRGYGVKARAVKGHPFGLDLSEEERKALIAFLRTL